MSLAYTLYPPLTYQICPSVSVLPDIPALCIFVMEGTVAPIVSEVIEEFLSDTLPADIDSMVVLKTFE